MCIRDSYDAARCCTGAFRLSQSRTGTCACRMHRPDIYDKYLFAHTLPDRSNFTEDLIWISPWRGNWDYHYRCIHLLLKEAGILSEIPGGGTLRRMKFVISDVYKRQIYYSAIAFTYRTCSIRRSITEKINIWDGEPHAI